MKHVVILVLALASIPMVLAGSKRIADASNPPKKGALLRVFATFLLVSFGLIGTYLTYGAIQSGLVHCLGRGCGFYYSAAVQPVHYWIVVGVWYFISMFILSSGIAVARNLVRRASEP